MPVGPDGIDFDDLHALIPLGCVPDLRCDCTVFGHVVQLIDGRVAIAAFVDTFANIAGDAGSRRDFDAGP